MKPVDVKKSAYIRALIYGDSGVGKTYLVGSFTQCPKTSPVLVLNARGQPVSLRAYDPPPLVLDMEAVKDFNNPYRWLKAGQPPNLKSVTPFGKAVNDYFDGIAGALPKDLEGDPIRKFKTVAIDSITHVQRISLEYLTEATGTMPGDYTSRPQIQHWGQVLSQLTRLADHYYRLPLHVVITALARRDDIEAMGVTLFCPFIWGQGRLEVPSHAELVGRLVGLDSLRTQQVTQMKTKYPKEMVGAYNVLLTKSSRTFLAKWQGILKPPEIVVAPTAQRLVDILDG